MIQSGRTAGTARPDEEADVTEIQVLASEKDTLAQSSQLLMLGESIVLLLGVDNVGTGDRDLWNLEGSQPAAVPHCGDMVPCVRLARGLWGWCCHSK